MVAFAEEFDDDLSAWTVNTGSPTVSGGKLNLALSGAQTINLSRLVIPYGHINGGYAAVLPVLPDLGSASMSLKVWIEESDSTDGDDLHWFWYSRNWPPALAAAQEHYNPLITVLPTGSTGWTVFYCQYTERVDDIRGYDPALPWSRVERSGWDFGAGQTSDPAVIPATGVSGGPLSVWASDVDSITVQIEAESASGSGTLGVESIRIEYTAIPIPPSVIPNLGGAPDGVTATFTPAG